jgi:hypothetical protein
MPTKKLNRIRCALCGSICTSRHVHDYVSCECGAVSCDGGSEYNRYIGELKNILVYNNRQWVPLKINNTPEPPKPREIRRDGILEKEINAIQWLRKIFKIG